MANLKQDFPNFLTSKSNFFEISLVQKPTPISRKRTNSTSAEPLSGKEIEPDTKTSTPAKRKRRNSERIAKQEKEKPPKPSKKDIRPKTLLKNKLFDDETVPWYFPIILLQVLEADEHRVFERREIPKMGLGFTRVTIRDVLNHYAARTFDLMDPENDIKLQSLRDLEDPFEACMNNIFYRLEVFRRTDVYKQDMKSGEESKLKWTQLLSPIYFVRWCWYLASKRFPKMAKKFKETNPDKDFYTEDHTVKELTGILSFIADNKNKYITGEDYDPVSPEYFRLVIAEH